MTAKTNPISDVEVKKNLSQEITKKLSLLPTGSTLEEITKRVREAQKESLLDMSLHEVLTIPANPDPHLINRMTCMNEARLEDDYFFKVHDVCGFKRFASEEHKMMFENINNQIKESYMAMGGSFWNGIVSILAGRAPGDTGIFRGILQGFIQKLMDRDQNKIKP
jgi:uncharacterized protein YeeX (DUF496 family)